MRPSGRGDTESLYFNYPHFEPPKNRDNLTKSTAVAIVGAGPIGMTAALTLAQNGIRSIVLDAQSTFNDGSRAICVARQSFRILERIGAVAPFLKKALPWTTGRSFYRGQQILEFQMRDSPHEKFRPMYNIQQQYIEQYLWDAICQEPLIEVRWQSKVTGIKDHPNKVTLTVEDPNDTYQLDCDWILAADGARSTVRKLRGLRLKGENYEGRYVIADIQMKHDFPTIRRALFDPACRRGGTILIHKEPDDIWRIDYQLDDDEDEATATREDTVRASVDAVLKEIGYDGEWDLEWWSVYSANTLALDDYRDGRIFFIGDSAHIVPIFGVRGLNNGLADAYDIGWKLAWVLQAKASETLLDSYTPERRGATMDVFANATKSARFMTPPTSGWQLMRDAALNLALSHPFAGNLANPRQMTPYTYADSPIVLSDDLSFSGGPVAGAVLPDVKYLDGFLSEQLCIGFTLITFDNALTKTASDLGLKHVIVPYDSDAGKILSASPQSAYLIRPDTHIAARWTKASSKDVRCAMTKIISGEKA